MTGKPILIIMDKFGKIKALYTFRPVKPTCSLECKTITNCTIEMIINVKRTKVTRKSIPVPNIFNSSLFRF